VTRIDVFAVTAAPPVTTASTLFPIVFFVNEPPIAKLPAPAPATASVEWGSTSRFDLDARSTKR